MALSDKTWCHVGFSEQGDAFNQDFRWLFVNDRCKHCGEAGCLEVCPTGAIYRTETGAVNINTSVCNGCQNCVSACPFGVVSFDHDTRVVGKCTLCPDRTEVMGREPACVTACPTDALVWGPRSDMLALAEKKWTTKPTTDIPGSRAAGVRFYSCRQPAAGAGRRGFFPQSPCQCGRQGGGRMISSLQVSEWPWYFVAVYFFLGGIAPGAYLLATSPTCLATVKRTHRSLKPGTIWPLA